MRIANIRKKEHLQYNLLKYKQKKARHWRAFFYKNVIKKVRLFVHQFYQ